MKHNSESGNVFFYILIAIALLVALSYAISQNNQGSVKAVSDEKARLYATEIIEYANILSNAVAQLRLRGCSDTEISFENTTVAGYTNGTNTNCQVFHPDGGGITYSVPTSEAMDNSFSASAFYQEWSFASQAVTYVGTPASGTRCILLSAPEREDCVDLVLFVSHLNETVCKKINDLIGIDNPSDSPPADDTSGTQFPPNGSGPIKFSGSYSSSRDDILSGHERTKSACYEEQANTGIYVFYKVLLAR